MCKFSGGAKLETQQRRHPPNTPATEGDIDLILVEELYSSSAFRDWFCQRAFGNGINLQHVLSLDRNCWDTYGEADLIFVFVDVAGRRIACLIENKIDAVLQLRQPERYKLRGQSGVENDRWDEFKSCLIAPRAYLSVAQEQFDCAICYEDLIAWFRSAGLESRGGFKVRLLESAIMKRLSYKGLIDEVAFFASMEIKERLAIINARRLLGWSQSRSSGVKQLWTKNAFKVIHARTGATILYCDTAGGASVAFRFLRNYKPFEERAAREQLLEQINLVNAVSLKDIDGQFEGFSMKALAEPDLAYLIEMLCWIVESLDKGVLSDPPRFHDSRRPVQSNMSSG